jgi:hypothetical protein
MLYPGTILKQKGNQGLYSLAPFLFRVKAYRYPTIVEEVGVDVADVSSVER